MSCRRSRVFDKTKSPYLRGLSRGNGPIVPAVASVSERDERGGKSDAFDDFIPDVSGGFLPPEAEFLADFGR